MTAGVGQCDVRAVGDAKQRDPLGADRVTNRIDVFGHVGGGVEVAPRTELRGTPGDRRCTSPLDPGTAKRSGPTTATEIDDHDIAAATLSADQRIDLVVGYVGRYPVERGSRRLTRAAHNQEERRASRPLGLLALDVQRDGAGDLAGTVERHGKARAGAAAAGRLAEVERSRSLADTDRQRAAGNGQ